MTPLTTASTDNLGAASSSPPVPAWPPASPQLLREYSRARDFHRQALHLARSGWHPIAVTATGVPFTLRALNVLSLGLYSLFARVEPSLLVTYSTTPTRRS